jgi:hypothetical protein
VIGEAITSDSTDQNTVAALPEKMVDAALKIFAVLTAAAKAAPIAVSWNRFACRTQGIQIQAKRRAPAPARLEGICDGSVIDAIAIGFSTR